MNAKVHELLNQQINKEFYSAYLYLDFSNYFEDAGLDGFANWYKIQAQEERDHAMLFVTYLLNNGSKLDLSDVKAASTSFANYKEPLQAAFQHELAVTKSIYKIYDEAQNLKDFRTMQFLDWFVKEQGEEEKNIEDLVKKYDLFGNDERGLFLLNNEAAARPYVAPSLTL